MLEKLIGRGGSSKVYMATHVETEAKIAIKILRKDKKFTKAKEVEIVETEYVKMKLVEGHPNILKSYYSTSVEKLGYRLEYEDVIYHAIEFADNGSLSKMIRSTGGLGEDLAKFYFWQIWHAVAHIHSFGIAHMDIKLENILLDKFFNAKVADFGISLDVSNTNGLSDSIRGTKCYMAPEVSHLLPSETYDAYKADVYSLGIWLYAMLFGEFPITESSETDSVYSTNTIGWITGLKISTENKKHWENTSTELQDLLGNMLSLDPDERPILTEILKSDWLKDLYDWEISQYVFEEMELRKQFMTDQEQKMSNKNSSITIHNIS